MTQKSNGTRFILGPGRLSFPKLFVPNDKEFGGKYATTILLPPGYDFGPLKAAMKDVAVKKFGPDQKKWPHKMRGPKDIIRPCEEKSGLQGYLPGWHFVTAASADMPGVVDAMLKTVNDQREVYPGRWAKVSVNVYAYSNVTHGVSLGLQNVQLLRHDDPFGSRVRPEDEFEEAYEDMQDADNYQKGRDADADDGDGDGFGGGGSAGDDWDD